MWTSIDYEGGLLSQISLREERLGRQHQSHLQLQSLIFLIERSKIENAYSMTRQRKPETAYGNLLHLRYGSSLVSFLFLFLPKIFRDKRIAVVITVRKTDANICGNSGPSRNASSVVSVVKCMLARAGCRRKKARSATQGR
jgi:hypothetical protein